MKYEGSITDIKGIKVGQYTDKENKTGCTVLLCPDGAVAGVDVRGAAPGTRETDLLDPVNTVEKVHAILLAGGSAFGLDAASGVMKWLENNGYGFDVGVCKVPIVPAAVLFDLAVGSHNTRPNAYNGFMACETASHDIKQGAHGAGTGATVGKFAGMDCAAQGGIGTSSIKLSTGATISAMIAVNSVGNVHSYETGALIAGCTNDFLAKNLNDELLKSGANTTIGIIATDAVLNKSQAKRLAMSGHDGISMTIRPAHTTMDGDTLFVLSYGDKKADLFELCSACAIVVAQAIINAVQHD